MTTPDVPLADATDTTTPPPPDLYPTGLPLRAEHVGEFVYGTTAVLIAMAGIDMVGGAAPEKVAAITLAGAVAMWVTHAYAWYLGERVTHGAEATRRDLVRALGRSGPIVAAAIPATALLALATAGVLEVRTAILLADAIGIAVLALAGWLGARVTGGDRVQATIWAVATASIGIGIVLVELALHA